MQELRDKLRVICHDLRMRPLIGIDPAAIPDLQSRISKLPSAQAIANLDEGSIKTLQGRVDRLLYDVARHDNERSRARAVRYQVETKLPPKRQPLFAAQSGWYRTARAVEGEIPPFIRKQVLEPREAQICPNCNQEILEKHSYCPDYKSSPDVMVHSDCGKSYRTWMTEAQKAELEEFERRFGLKTAAVKEAYKTMVIHPPADRCASCGCPNLIPVKNRPHVTLICSTCSVMMICPTCGIG